MTRGFFSPQERDDNEREIIDALHLLGAYVQQMDKSAGFDLLVGWRGILLAIEVKQPEKKLSPREKEIANDFQYFDLPYKIIRSIDDMIAILEAAI